MVCFETLFHVEEDPKKKFRKLRKIKKEGKNKDFILKLSLLYEKIESLIEIP